MVPVPGSCGGTVQLAVVRRRAASLRRRCRRMPGAGAQAAGWLCDLRRSGSLAPLPGHVAGADTIQAVPAGC